MPNTKITPVMCQFIRALRAVGITVTAIAAKAEVSPSTVRRHENGRCAHLTRSTT